ncbi:MAG: YceI family protein [Rubrimonas sp.]|uniref:YceI family protein n=1 Tax=Rubrimonas sp. TaxID=2036015 RepID=UPI002FDD26B1
MRHSLIAAAFAAALAAPAFAEGWELDKSHAHVTFTADHLGFSMVHGQFRAFDIDVALDPEDFSSAEVRIVIDASSIDTAWEPRDTHLRNADFLDVASHPEITFVSTRVTPTGENAFEITGDLTLRGVTRETTFAATMNKLAPSPFNPEITVAGFAVTGEIVRAEHGMNFASGAFDVIPVRADFEITRQR